MKLTKSEIKLNLIEKVKSNSSFDDIELFLSKNNIQKVACYFNANFDCYEYFSDIYTKENHLQRSSDPIEYQWHFINELRDFCYSSSSKYQGWSVESFIDYLDI